MKIAVLVKQVPDTETKLKFAPGGAGIDESETKYIVNPYDENAIEQALLVKQAAGGDVFAVALGPVRVVDALRTALAMGADKAIHISSDGVTLDNYTAALAIANALKDQGFDLVFCGKQAIDDDSAQVGPMVAEFLGLPQVTVADKMDLGADKASARIQRPVGGGSAEVYNITFPALISCDKGLNTPRYASLPGIMKAKTKPLETKKAADLLGGATALVELSNFQAPPPRPEGRILKGDVKDQVKELVTLLRNEAKVI